MRLRVLIACEFSGVVRDAFAARGHDALSCDLLPSERPGPHVTGDALGLIHLGWDLLIAHPPCTYLCNSGVRWLKSDGNRWSHLVDAALFFASLRNAPIARIAVENPIMHGYGRAFLGGHTQLIQPYHFGHDETKATCLWLKNLPPLVNTHERPSVIRDRVHRLSPGPDRWRERSRTFEGIAAAMADQWG